MWLAGSHVFRKTFSSLSADRWRCVPPSPLLVIWPEAPRCWSLWSVGWDEVLVRRWWPPGEFTPMSTPQNYCCQGLWPHREPQPLPASAGDPPVLTVGLAQALMRSLLFPLGTGVYETSYAPSTGRVSVSPSPVNSWSQTLLAFKARCSEGSSKCQTPGLGSLMWGSELLHLLESICDIIIFHFEYCVWQVWDLILPHSSPSCCLDVASSLSWM